MIQSSFFESDLPFSPSNPGVNKYDLIFNFKLQFFNVFRQLDDWVFRGRLPAHNFSDIFIEFNADAVASRSKKNFDLKNFIKEKIFRQKILARKFFVAKKF